jgi:membrane-bound lytic murein transglycosylase B
LTVDGVQLGATPLSIESITPGEHSLIISKVGYESRKEQINIASGEKKTVEYPLIQSPLDRHLWRNALVGILVAACLVIGYKIISRPKEKAQISISTSPSGASLTIDGQNKGQTPTTGMSVNSGTHHIVVEKNGYLRTEQDISLGPGEKKSLVVTLEKKSVDSAEMNIITTPDKAYVFVDDDRKGTTPLTLKNITPGEHSLNISKAGYENRDERINIADGEKKIVEYLLASIPEKQPPTGDGDEIGATPVSSGNNQKKLTSLEQYRNMYEPSEINYSLKYPIEFNMLYNLLKETLEKKELEDTINRKASQLDKRYLDKIRFYAVPDSLEQQQQQHIDYVPILVNDTTLREGISFFDEYKDTIMKAYSKYNVRPEDIIAVINWESRFGKFKGEYSVYKVFVGNLFNISEIENQFYAQGGYDKKDIMPRDKALARIGKLKQTAARNLASLLKLSIKKNFNPYEIKGSWAGAIGIPQFMPSSMIYAADGDGNGEIDLNNMHDAIFSVASFLHQHSYATKGPKYALAKYNPEEMYVRGVCLYSSRIIERGLSY